MKNWKPIVAVAVIFVAGFTSGALIGRNFDAAGQQAGGPKMMGPPPGIGGPKRGGEQFRKRFIDDMKRELNLTPEQAETIETTMRESHERMARLWEPIEPKARQEFQQTREKIRSVLTEEQRVRFEEVFQPGKREHDGPRERGPGRREFGPGGEGRFGPPGPEPRREPLNGPPPGPPPQ